MAAILDSLGFTFLIDRMTEVLTPDIYIELTGLNAWAYLINAPVSREAFIRLHELFIRLYIYCIKLYVMEHAP